MSPNAQLATYIFAETARGNGRPFFEAMADDATWRTIGSNSWSGTFSGKSAIIDEIFRPLRARLGPTITVATRIVDGGNIVVVQARGQNATIEGVAYENDYCFVMRFADGKIAAFEEYCDTELVSSALGEREPAAACV